MASAAFWTYSLYRDIGSTYMELLRSSNISLPTKSGSFGRDHLTSRCGSETNAAVMRREPQRPHKLALVRIPQKGPSGQRLQLVRLLALEHNHYVFAEPKSFPPPLWATACKTSVS